VRLTNIQRRSSLDTSAHEGERTREHVERLRPEYERRIHWIHALAGHYVVSPNGSPVL